MIYSFFDPEHEQRSGLGNYIILDHIQRASADGLPFVYLGYWVKGSGRMEYKIRYRRIETLGPEGWRRMADEEQDALIRASLEPRKTEQPSGQPADRQPADQESFAFSSPS